MNPVSLRSFSRLAVCAAFAAFSALATTAASAAEEINLYTTREPALIQPLLDAFTQAHQGSIQVNTVFIKDGLLERVKAEGARSPPMC